jgi:acyl-coenzyme A synthetase/AMP-(fatty) acid ligase
MWLWSVITESGQLEDRFLRNARANVSLAQLETTSCLGGRLEELRGRNVIVSTADQFATAIALIELDGVARRVVLCPPDLSAEYLPLVARKSSADAWVGTADDSALDESNIRTLVTLGPLEYSPMVRRQTQETSWVLLTSGTTGAPKLVLHTLASLTNAIIGAALPGPRNVWSTFYDIRRYGGLQILMRGLWGGSLVLPNLNDSIDAFLIRSAEAGVTHISGTPSHWRKALMSGAISAIAPQYVRLSGEIADQGILDALRRTFPGVTVAHAFASTEAGVGFEVRDGYAGFPASFIGAPDIPAEIEIVDGQLRLRSCGTAVCYLGADAPSLRSPDNFVDTGDRVELRNSRYYFTGRSGGVINVGGQKVYPEEVESVINSLPWVRISRVVARKSPILGAVVTAEVVPSAAACLPGSLPDEEQIMLAIINACRKVLAPHKVPASIRLVSSLEVTQSGKLVRTDA